MTGIKRKESAPTLSREKPTTNRFTRQVIDNWKNIERTNQNKHVRIKRDRLEHIVGAHFADNFSIPTWDQPEGIYPKDNKAFSAQAVVSSIFNFAYNNPEVADNKYTLSARPIEGIPTPQFPLSGALAMQRRIYEAFGENTDITSAMLNPYDSEEGIHKLFGDIPLANLRQAVLHDYIEGLDKYFGGSTAKLLESAKVTTRRGHTHLKAFGKSGLVEQLVTKFSTAFGKDKQALYGQAMPFYKRAQLAVALIEGRAVNGREEGFGDIDMLGPIADYQLPKALRSMGILSYTTDLAQSVDNWQVIKEGSAMEGEIRGATVTAVQELLEGINSKRKVDRLSPINMCHLDYWLWSMGRAHKTARPHITPTSNY